MFISTVQKSAPPSFPSALLVCVVALLSVRAFGASAVLSAFNTTELPTISIPSVVRNQFAFPTDNPTLVSSSFGPRWRYAKSEWEFHAGVDFFNATDPSAGAIPIYAIGAGTVYAKYVYPDARFPNGGNALSVEHQLAAPILFHGVNVTKMYSVYLHLDQFSSNTDVGAVILKGQTIGAMGQTGDTEFLHLHFETRLGTMCSLPYQLANPSSGCSVLKQEPKVSPFLFLPDMPSGRGTTPLSTAIASVVGDSSARRVTLLVPSRRSIILNRVRFASVDLDFSLYGGFDPTDVDRVSNFTFPWGRLVPGIFLSTSEVFNMTLEFNAGSALPANDTTFYFFDARGNGVATMFPAAAATPNPGTTSPATPGPSGPISPAPIAAPLTPAPLFVTARPPSTSSGSPSNRGTSAAATMAAAVIGIIAWLY